MIGVATLGLSVLLSACAGGATSSISKAEFLKQANGICQAGHKEVEAVAARLLVKGGGSPNRATRSKVVVQVPISNIQHEIDAIRALGAPVGDEATVETILSEEQRALDVVTKDPALWTSKRSGPFMKADKFANSYGLTACVFELEVADRH